MAWTEAARQASAASRRAKSKTYKKANASGIRRARARAKERTSEPLKPFASQAQWRWAMATKQPWAKGAAAVSPSFKSLPKSVAKKKPTKASAGKAISEPKARRRK